MKNIIELKNVYVIRNNKKILKNINWKIKKNENWAIIGRNGSGKSFLLKLISANLYPTKGSIKIFDQEFGKVNLWDLKNKIGFVSDLFQKEYDENTKVINVVYSGFFSSNGLYEEPDESMIKKTYEILDFLNINNLKNRIFGELSHGEQRKVLIARSLVFDPKLLIFDEPCTGLDVVAKEDFLKIIEKIVKKGHNIIFVTHHVDEIIPAINKVLFIKNGEIIKNGNKNKMMKNNVLKKVFNSKFKILKIKEKYIQKNY